MANKQNRKGRSKSSGTFVMLDEYVLRSEAYRHLSVYGRVLLVELIRKYDGKNNSFIGMSLRDAADLSGCSEKPIRKAFKELQSKGFLKLAKKGAYSVKNRHATEWTLTQHPVNNTPATKDFMRWIAPPKSRKKLKRGVPRVQSQRTDGTNQSAKQAGKPCDGVPRVRRQGQKPDCDSVLRVRTYPSVPYGVTTDEKLQTIANLMPDGWCKPKAQAHSGMGNKVAPLPVKNQSEKVTERQAISVRGHKQ